MSTNPMIRRTCPWCGVANVYAFTDEGVLRALTTHLETCETDQPSPEPEQLG